MSERIVGYHLIERSVSLGKADSTEGHVLVEYASGALRRANGEELNRMHRRLLSPKL